jgi:hypothetical protein
MKVFIIVFNDLEIALDKVYTSRAQAEKDMRRLIDATDAQAAEAHAKSYSHFYAIDELELVTGEEMTLEEVFDL